MVKFFDNYTQEELVTFAEEIINSEDFDIIKLSNGKFALRDYQRANLGGIEGDEFDTLFEILDRLEIYHDDYYFKHVEEELDIDNFDWTDNDVITLIKMHPDFEYDIRVIHFIINAQELLGDLKPNFYEE